MESQLRVRAPCAFVKLTDKGRPYLQRGVTTIMLKFLPPKTTSEMLIRALDERLPGRFDFFYLPRSRQRRARSIDMCFVNFIDHQSAVQATDFFSEEFASARFVVCQAGIQGLVPNLALFVLRFGMESLLSDEAPELFHRGHRLSVQEAFSVGMIAKGDLCAAVQELEHRLASREDDPKSEVQSVVWQVVFQGPLPRRGPEKGTSRSLTVSAEEPVADEISAAHHFFVDADTDMIAPLQAIVDSCQDVVVSL